MAPAVGTAIAGIFGAGAQMYGANEQENASIRAANMQSASNALAMEQQKAQDAQHKAEFDTQQAELKRQWDATQAFNANVYNTQQARLAPYRAASTQALGRLGDLLGMHFDTSTPPPTTYQTQPFNSNPGAAAQPPPTATAAPAAAAPLSLAPAMAMGSPAPQGVATSPSYTPVIPFSQMYQTNRNLAARPQ
jgi:hypothetical protein